ncbi:putative HTH-type transcriptional regulator YtcD [Brevundimonas sp. SH203]|uniref:winged helix-turn-helix transcriptional regulator n=1 Tax=Brevundimonas sp. SH203 TaxID=345167 RepID=UPI0009C9AAD1|nr:winged helix-turn-helix transcriptional regulator [Brevundimonas sp. SH203]GAW41451.1 putative HTH-type transcriptional regulator YtcD [Brevundimonas sp. SH203]
MARAATLLGDKWTLLILREAFYGVSRFEDLRLDLAAPRAALSQRLDTLVADGVLERSPYKENNSRLRHEYRLTPKGRELAIILIAIMQWGDRHMRDDAPPLVLRDQDTHEALTLALTTASGRIVSPDKIEKRLRDDQE